MSACGFGASGLKIQNMNFSSVRPKFRAPHLFHGLRTPEIVRFEGLVLFHRSEKKALLGCQSLVSKADCELIFFLMLRGFQLYVSRDLAEQVLPPEPPAPTPVTAHSVIETHNSNGSALSPSLALSKPSSPSGGVQALLDKAVDEGLAILKSPRVGVFRRSRTIKGKKAPSSCKEKDGVREGQVLCYIDQLGGEIPIESDVAGEVVKILREDGDPVGYGDALIALLPSFPGIKKLQ